MAQGRQLQQRQDRKLQQLSLLHRHGPPYCLSVLSRTVVRWRHLLKQSQRGTKLRSKVAVINAAAQGGIGPYDLLAQIPLTLDWHIECVLVLAALAERRTTTREEA